MKKEAAARAEVNEAEGVEEEQLCVGRRIVELSELGKNLKCCQCTHPLAERRCQRKKAWLKFNFKYPVSKMSYSHRRLYGENAR